MSLSLIIKKTLFLHCGHKNGNGTDGKTVLWRLIVWTHTLLQDHSLPQFWTGYKIGHYSNLHP